MADPLIAVVDVDYRSVGAVAAGLWVRGWPSDAIEHQAAVGISVVADYVPGEFYRRELPCLLSVLAAGPRPDIVLIDGYVWLAADRPGLGAQLHTALGGPAVVGLAKTRFAGAAAAEVVRGRARPLFVTAVGLATAVAAAGVQAMHGPNRRPTLVTRADRLARTAAR